MPEGTTPLFNNFRTGKPTAVVDAIPAGSITTTMLADNSVDNTKLADMDQALIKGRASGAGTGDPQDLTGTQATAILNNFVGDSGSGGTKGLVPAPAAGDAAAGKFLKADGTFATVTSPGLVLLNSGTISSAQATLDIVLTSFTSYRAIKFLLSAFIPVTDDVELWMRFSTDGGSTYDATGYRYALAGIHDNNANLNIFSQAANQIVIAGHTTALLAISNTASEGGVDAEIVLHNQINTSRWPKARINSAGILSAASNVAEWNGSGARATAQDTDAVRFLFESGNIASGDWALYGLT